MGWAKYAEDNNEIFCERMDQIVSNKSPHIKVMTTIPLMACPVEISIKVSPDKKQAEPKVKHEDKNLYCQDCEKAFVFSAGEQRFYKKKGLNQPKRCKACRETNEIKHLVFDTRR